MSAPPARTRATHLATLADALCRDGAFPPGIVIIRGSTASVQVDTGSLVQDMQLVEELNRRLGFTPGLTEVGGPGRGHGWYEYGAEGEYQVLRIAVWMLLPPVDRAEPPR